MAPFSARPKIIAKIKELHQVEVEEVREAFYNLQSEMQEERRLEHQTRFRRMWFISETDKQRLLKVVLGVNEDLLELITAYDPDEEDLDYYEKLKKND